MKLNIEKCNCLNVGKKNINFEYELKGLKLNKTKEQKDLGIIISNNLKVNVQVTKASKKANKMLGYIKRNFEYKNKDIIIPLYKSLVRPHLEYAIQFWAPYHQKDIDALERIQRRATKLVPNLKNMSYENRLKSLKLYTLKTRRLRGELIEVFKF